MAACVRDNLVRYSAPDRAVVQQYLSVEAACHALVFGDEQAAVTVSPISGAGSGEAEGARESAPPAPRGDGVAEPDATRDRKSAGGGSAPNDPTPRPTAGARATVLSALERADSAGASPAPRVIDGPAWLLWLVGGLLGIVAGAGWIGVRSRQK